MTVLIKIPLLFILICSNVLATAQETIYLESKGFSDDTKIDTLYYPFYNGKQLIIIDYLSQFEQIDSKYSQTMSSLPPGYNDRVIGNEYFVRNLTGKVIKSFNSSHDLDSISNTLRPVNFINQTLHNKGIYNLYNQKREGFYEIYNVTVTEYNKNDTTIELKTGIIDSFGNIVLPIQYRDLRKIKDHFLVSQKVGGGDWGLIDEQLNYKVPPNFKSFNDEDSIIYFYGSDWIESVYNVNSNKFNDLRNIDLGEFDYSRGYLKIRENGKWGLMNVCSNEVLVPCKYDQIVNYYYSDDWMNPILYKGLVIVSNEGKFGIVTVGGETILDCIYEKIYRENESESGIFKVIIEGEITEIKNKCR